MDVLFVMPPGGVASRHGEHLGIAFLRTMLQRAGIRARQYLPERNVSPAAFASDLLELRPRVVGFTVYESNRTSCRAMAAVVRSSLPGAVILAGGPSATFSPDETLEFLGADACLRGAGEGAVVPMAEAVVGADEARGRLVDLLGGIPNLAIRSGDGVHHTLLGTLSSFPGPPFACLDDVPSPYQAGLITSAEVGYLTARGCNQHCTYCSFAAISERRVHRHGLERVLEDLAVLRRVVEASPRHPRSVPIGDDAFTLIPRRAEAICEGIVARGLQMPFDCETRADRVDAGLLRLMRRAGFVGVAFGLESAVPRVLRAAGKVQDPGATDDPGFERERAYLEAVRRAVVDARSAGLHPSVSVIGGLPGEGPEDFHATLDFVRRLEVPVYAHNVLTLMPGTPLHDERARHGLDASRHPVTGRWRTLHAYDVEAVEPLWNSTIQLERSVEAERICDALCGRPRTADADDRSPWAAVIHADAPDAATLGWLAGILAVPATVVVVTSRRGSPETCEDWERAVARSGLSVRHLALLDPEDSRGAGMRFATKATRGRHRVEIQGRWDAGAGGPAADPSGDFRVPVWIASRADAPPSAPGGSLGQAVPQVADGCRWWDGWRRCRQPRVLHVGPEGSVRPCWNGPPIGKIGDPFAVLVARGRALGETAGEGDWRVDWCPLGTPVPGAAEAESLELASQLSWLGARRMA
jgi:radical SAM superfamily enzyme YgiQ (UPF0313 family)